MDETENSHLGPVVLSDVEEREIMPGFRGRMVHCGSMTLAYWDVDEGSMLPEHHHPHEQVVNMLEGFLEIVLDSTAHRLSAGDVLIIPPNVSHSGRAITSARVLDVFSPVRDDYR